MSEIREEPERPADQRERRRENEPPRRAVCGICGSARVRIDASAYWNIKKQKWCTDVDEEVGYCLDCGGGNDYVERVLDYEPVPETVASTTK